MADGYDAAWAAQLRDHNMFLVIAEEIERAPTHMWAANIEPITGDNAQQATVSCATCGARLGYVADAGRIFYKDGVEFGVLTPIRVGCDHCPGHENLIQIRRNPALER